MTDRRQGFPFAVDSTATRREFLARLGAAGALAVMSRAAGAAQSRVTKMNVRGGAIDVHHHHAPPALNGGRGAAVGSRGAAPPGAARGRARGSDWTPDRSLEAMDKFGISVAILSMTQMGDLLYSGTEGGRTAVRTGNEYGARLVQQYPKRYGLFGSVPLPDIDGTLKEIEYCYDTLRVDGVGIYTNDNKGRWPGDKYFEPMWQELNRRNAVVFVHPLAPTCCNNLGYGAAANMLEYDFDVTRAVTSIVVNGVMFRYPNVRFITVHSGGTVPMLAGRMKDRYPDDGERLKYIPNGLWAELRKWYYDIAHASFSFPMSAMMKFMPPERILFGTDYSPEPIETTVDELPNLGLSKEFMQMMARGNAERLFPRFKV